MDKRGISDLVSTVLLILIAIVAAGLLGYFLMNWFKANTEKITACNDATLEVKTDSGYTCYTDNSVNIQVARGAGNTDLAGIQLLVSGNGASKTIEVRQNQTNANVGMYGSNQTTLDVPGRNEALTYSISRDSLKMTTVDNVAAISIVKIGNSEILCSAPPTTAITPCSTF